MEAIEAESRGAVDDLVNAAIRKKTRARAGVPRDYAIKGEQLLERAAKLPPEDLKTLVISANKMSPRHARRIQREIIEHMVESWTAKETTAVGRRLAIEGQRGLDVQKIARGMLEQKPRLKALLGPNHPVFKHMKSMQKVARRQAATAGTAGEVAHIPIGQPIYQVGRIAARAQDIAEAIAIAIRPKQFAEIMLDPVKAKAFMQLTDPPKWWTSPSVTRAIAAVTSREYMREEVKE